MTDTDLLNQQESLHIQVWPRETFLRKGVSKGITWTAWKPGTKTYYPVQSTKPTLREALSATITTQPEPRRK